MARDTDIDTDHLTSVLFDALEAVRWWKDVTDPLRRRIVFRAISAYLEEVETAFEEAPERLV